ncbi:TIGR02147 family protein [Chitinispirillales bacterium ANBcel5]|uniref:TIGR02147 family protein n=1 Tax=Cellulosispirillum alkaliphilum TaxID=3039283 RepID=UPI002A537A4E|nr:TIGR02147 family protein [Chitinispirillales bacterium ANBcel5]
MVKIGSPATTLNKVLVYKFWNQYILYGMCRLFDSLDYRQYLKERFDDMRRERPWFSNRLIAQRLKIDPGQLVKILQGQRHISERLLPAFIKFLNLEDREKEYFTCLVRFNKAKIGSEVSLYYEKLMALKGLSLPQVKPDQDHFFNQWYYSVIRVLLAFHGFDGDYEKLGSMLSPPIKGEQAKEAVELLLKLGFIEKDEDNSFKLTDTFISGGGDWRMYAVRNFQQQTIKLSERSLLNDSPEIRDISSLTISLSEEEIVEYKEMIEEFRKTLLRRVMESGKEPNRVYQLNLQLIPVASVKKRAGEKK